MGYAQRRNARAGQLAGDVIRRVISSSESSMRLTELAIEMAARCLDATAGAHPLSEQETLDYRRNVQESHIAITKAREELLTLRRIIFGDEG